MADQSLRQYQLDVVSSIQSAFKLSNKVMMVLPTGAGKTRTASILATHYNNVLWIAHRRELLDQADNVLKLVGHKNYVLQSIFKDPPDKHFDLLITDECHHAPIPTIIGFLKKAKFDRFLGLTATPERLDRQYLGFDVIVNGADGKTLTTTGYLTPTHLYTIRSHDVVDNDLIDWMTNHKDRLGKTILFVRNLAHAEILNGLLSKNFNVAIITSDSNRDDVLHKFKNGDIDIIISCLLLTEGIDIPDTKTIIIAKNSNSKTMINQMVGRGIRPVLGKTHCNVIEIINVYDKKKSISSMIKPDKHFICYKDGETWVENQL